MSLSAALFAATLLAGAARAELPRDDWAFEDGYNNDLLYVHALSQYAWDLEEQFHWERQQYAGNALRVNTGSVSSDRLFTDIDLTVNEALNARWRFIGRFDRNGERRRSATTEQLQIGFERQVLQDSAVFVTLNPEYNKAFMDVAAGIATYRDDRTHYLRAAVVLQDFNFDSKNDDGAEQTQQAVALQWQARWPLANAWIIYSEGSVGRGYKRQFNDTSRSPELRFAAQRTNTAELRASKQDAHDHLWSVSAQWYDFSDAQRFDTPGADYDYTNREVVLGAEHVRKLSDKHRLRVLASYVDRQAQSAGFRAHDYTRSDILGGVFYEYLRVNSGITIGYTAGLPDFSYDAVLPANRFSGNNFTDKLIVGFRYTFSQRGVLRASVSQEVSQRGFGGGAVQYQMFF
ncbi:MAG: hypothetical protein AAFO81_03625 [Pseudomonadota bacterium]